MKDRIVNPERVPKGQTSAAVVTSHHWIRSTFPSFPKLDTIPVADLEGNKKHWLNNQLRKSKPQTEHFEFAKRCLAIHGTTLSAALDIINSGTIKSYSKLVESDHRFADSSMLLRTDELDIQLGLDQNVFLSLGRVNPLEIENVYFCFPNSVLDQTGTSIALREIVHFGALVSRAAIMAHEEHGLIKPNQAAEINQRAANHFFANLYRSEDFLVEIFPRFLALAKEYKHGNFEIKYSSSLEYPGEKLELVRLGSEVTVLGAWDGPQAMIPSSVSISDYLPAILIADTNQSSYQQIVETGYPKDRIFSIVDVLDPYFSWSRGSIGDFNKPLIPYRYLNLALRDISLISAFSRDGIGFPESMIAFKDRTTTL